MINSDPPGSEGTSGDDAVNRIVQAGASGALVLAGVATAVVVALWFAFYLLVFVPRAIGP